MPTPAPARDLLQGGVGAAQCEHLARGLHDARPVAHRVGAGPAGGSDGEGGRLSGHGAPERTRWQTRLQRKTTCNRSVPPLSMRSQHPSLTSVSIPRPHPPRSIPEEQPVTEQSFAPRRAVTSTEYAHRGWILAVMCTALVMVVAGVSMLANALPSIAASLDASQSSAAVDRRRLRADARRAAAPGRRARRPLRPPRRADRRYRHLRHRGRCCRPFASSAGPLDRRCAPLIGRRRRAPHARHAVDDHQRLPAGGAGQGGRHLGRLRRHRRHARHPRVGRAARAVLRGARSSSSPRGLAAALARRRDRRRAEHAIRGARGPRPASARCCRPSASACSCSGSSRAPSAAGPIRSRSSVLVGGVVLPRRVHLGASSAPTSRCSTRGCSRTAASPPGRRRCSCSSSPCSASSSCRCSSCSWCSATARSTAALALLPMSVVILPLSAVAGTLSERYGHRSSVASGLAVSAVGFGLFATLGTGSGYWPFLVADARDRCGRRARDDAGDQRDRRVAAPRQAGRRVRGQRHRARARRRVRRGRARQRVQHRVPQLDRRPPRRVSRGGSPTRRARPRPSRCNSPGRCPAAKLSPTRLAKLSPPGCATRCSWASGLLVDRRPLRVVPRRSAPKRCSRTTSMPWSQLPLRTNGDRGRSPFVHAGDARRRRICIEPQIGEAVEQRTRSR